MAEHDEGLGRHRGLIDVPAEWLRHSIANLTDEQIAQARADICAHQPRWLTHDRLGLYNPDSAEEGR